MKRTQQSFAKRQREQAKREKQQAKREKLAQRKPGETDDDIDLSEIVRETPLDEEPG